MVISPLFTLAKSYAFGRGVRREHVAGHRPQRQERAFAPGQLPLGQMEKPNVESIEGLSPAISIDQKSTNRNPRSTVGTVTEIYDYFRLLYARKAEEMYLLRELKSVYLEELSAYRQFFIKYIREL